MKNPARMLLMAGLLMASSALSASLPYRGVNLASAEFGVDAWGVGALPGTHGVDYLYPDPAYTNYSADYYIGRGMSTFRLPFRWERLQPARLAPLDANELTRMKTTVNRLVGQGMTVILDPHNYARYRTAVIGSAEVPIAHFSDFWSRLAFEFKDSPNVIFALMNEPHDMPTEQWVSAANAAISAIRATGARQLILVPGNGWTGAWAWSDSWYGTPNATAMLQIADSGNNFAFEVHQYLDSDSSSNQVACVSPTIGSERMQGFTSWLRANGRKGFLGEFAGDDSSVCLSAVDDLLFHLEANSDVYLGWTYWAGGPWWGNYVYSLEPTNGVDRPQMAILQQHLGAPQCQPKTYEAESMYHSTGSAIEGGWNISTNGYISTSHGFNGGLTPLTVVAKGSIANNAWPHMVVTVNGVTVGEATVSATTWTEYTFQLNASTAPQEIRVIFDNDYKAKGKDRNLYVDRVTVGCGG
ncbi:MAG TPA: cellulase family glycosylhydrolase [Archangium sp.]|nr:cellulase family glycosylhydrolase [Archangium sp.]